jgi:hypothetical protein
MQTDCASLALSLSIATLTISQAQAQTLVGTNAPGQGSNFTFTVGAGATNLSLVLSNNATAYSYLLLKKGGTPTDTVFDFAARLNGQTNEVNLEAPEYAAATYGLRVSTPATSATQSFQVVLTTNRTNLRSAGYPVLKPLVFSTTGNLTNTGSGAWHYFQVDVPSNLLTGWRIVLSTNLVTGNPDLYVRRGALPTTGSYDKASVNQAIDTIMFTSAEATPGTYFIGVYLGAATYANYTLSAELASITPLAWDPGTTDVGTQVFTNQSVRGGRLLLRNYNPRDRQRSLANGFKCPERRSGCISPPRLAALDRLIQLRLRPRGFRRLRTVTIGRPVFARPKLVSAGARHARSPTEPGDRGALRAAIAAFGSRRQQWRNGNYGCGGHALF